MIKDLEQKILAIIQRLWTKIEVEDMAVDLKQTNATRGDLATGISFVIAKMVNKTAEEVAEKIVSELKNDDQIIEAHAVNGFVNVRATNHALDQICDEIVKSGRLYGRVTIGQGKKARVEFISANPTGPLHMGNARGGPLGDVIAKVLEHIGYEVLREYYHNDVGNQVVHFGRSLLNVSQGQPLSEQEYQGGYILQLARQISSGVKTPEQAGEKAVEMILRKTLDTAKEMGIKFDKVYHESEFAQFGQTAKALGILKTKKLLRNQKGAVWFAPKDIFLEDRESVVIKSDGQYTYLANDIAYHQLKFREGYEIVVDILGPDHHGHVPRLQAVVAAMGFNVGKFHAVLYQYVRIRRGDKIIEMSKRAGNFVTAKEVLDEVGKDAFRFFILLHDANTHLDFDLELAKKRSQNNPVYYVQYAAVRAKAIIRKLQTNPKSQIPNPKLELVERKLIIHIARFPRLIEEISQTFKVHWLTRYAIDTARLFHDFYEHMPVIERAMVHEHRLKIVKATLVVLENTLNLLGVSVPERM